MESLFAITSADLLSYVMVSAILTYALFWQPYVIYKAIKCKIQKKSGE